MKYDFDEKIQRIGTDSEKWESGGHGGVYFDENSLSFSIADMDFALAPTIDKAIRDRLEKKVLGYTGVETAKYRDSVVNWFGRRFDWHFKGEMMHTVAGVMEGIHVSIANLTEEGEGVIIQQPVYPPFMRVVQSQNRKLVVNHLQKDDQNHYTIDFDELEKQASDPNNKILLFCSPHNPVGRVWTKEELMRVADICNKHGLTLISDEIHCDLIRATATHFPVAKLRPEYDIITCVSPSKSFNIAGLQMANIVFSNNRLKNRVVSEHGIPCANPLSIAAHIGAYNDSEDWLAQANDYMDENLKFLKDWLDKYLPKVKYLIPEGTYLAWLDVSAYQADSNKFAKDCGRGGIIVEQGDVFGDGGKGFIRFNVGTPRSVIEEGLFRMQKVVEKY